MKFTLLFSAVVLLCINMAAAGRQIQVLVWDEQQPEQKKAYTNFLGNQIASHLRTLTNLAVTSASINDLNQGLDPEALDRCDVLVWWGHVRHKEITSAQARRIVARIKENKTALIAIHSAHWAEPFVEAMRERAREDVLKLAPNATINAVTPPRFEAPKATSPLTPSHTIRHSQESGNVVELTLPRCVFPAWRADGAPSHVTVLAPKHPIATGLPRQFDIPQTEMYAEPFHVPEPDIVIAEERWDKGERFRSACLWKVGRGTVFYFRPGHETYPVFTQPLPLRIISNAVEYLGQQVVATKER